MIIIGITGTLGAGKGAIVDFLLKEKSFVHFSVREYLTKEIVARGLVVNRDSMVQIANELRASHSPAYIVEQLYEQALVSGKNCIIESIRTPGEAEMLKQKGGFFLFAVDAPPEIRYQRIKLRASATDYISYETFLENEKREMISDDPNKQNLKKCIEMSDYFFENNGDIGELHNKVAVVLNKIEHMPDEKKNEHHRPSWDEYFMKVADTVAQRATCDRGRSGCVITRDKQILVTGYVGSPMGLPHCDEVGHLFKQMTHEDGRVTNHCVRTVHAEQNAICQAARRGITLDKATLYCRMTPCRTCAMLIINCGIVRVVCEKKYHAGNESETMFKDAGVELVYMSEDLMKYSNQ